MPELVVLLKWKQIQNPQCKTYKLHFQHDVCYVRDYFLQESTDLLHLCLPARVDFFAHYMAIISFHQERSSEVVWPCCTSKDVHVHMRFKL